MMNEIEETKRAGKFSISPEKELYGELLFNGPKTSLSLQDRLPFSTHEIPDGCITGTFYDDLTKVTPIKCITLKGPGSGSRGDERYYFADLFPHYVIYGDRHITPAERSIASVHLVVDDASTLFYDFDAFGSLIDARPYIDQISRANALDRKIITGPNPAILYFTGKHEIFSADTGLGRISASHNPRYSLGGPDGVGIKNTISLNITYKEAPAFDEAIDHTRTVLRYLGMLVGRPQNVLELKLGIKSTRETPVFLEVYWCMPPKRDPSHEERNPHPTEVLLDAVGQPEAFSRVLGSWLDRERSWQDARVRFFNSFAQQQRYDIDRLIGAANMFDILPSEAVPRDVSPSDELMAAKENCRKIFKVLPPGPERSSILSALGRIGKSSLKQKIRHRAQHLIGAVESRFPDLTMVIDEAVDCRNHYVHGTEPVFDYDENPGARIFFTNTLEFVFAASDLIEAGWDIKAWCQIPTSMSHPFGAYRVNYGMSLQNLKSLLP